VAARARTGFQVVVWFAAANFAALVVAALVALATGALDLERVGAAARVLGGGSEAVPAGELAALEEARARLEGRRDEAALMDAWRSFRETKNDFEERSREEREALRMLKEEAAKVRGESERARAALSAEREEDAQRLRRQAAARRQDALDKVKRVYRYMRPVEVGRDLEARLEAGKTAEVAEILRAMNDRAAAEALEAIADPASRMRIYDALAGTTRNTDRP